MRRRLLSFIGKWFALLVAIAGGLALVSCGAAPAETPTPEVTEATAAPEATATPAQVTAGVGEAASLGRLVVTVEEAGSAGTEANEFATQGMRFYLVRLTVENAGDVRFVVDPASQMRLHDGAGRVHEVSPAAMTITEANPPDLELEGGQSVTGEVAFEIPVDAFGLEFVFDASREGLGTAVIDVGG